MFKWCIDDQYDGQSPQYSHVLNVLNIIFTALFTVEFLLKLMAFRFKVCLNPFLNTFYRLLIVFALNIYYFYFNPLLCLQNYFGDPWNCFDFFIVLGSLIDIVYEQLNVGHFYCKTFASIAMNVMYLISYMLVSITAHTNGRQNQYSSSETHFCDELSSFISCNAFS